MVIIGLVVYNNRPTEPVKSPPNGMIVSEKMEEVPYSAEFHVYTNGVERDFNAAMYHNLSENVYLDSEDSTKVVVITKDITWRKFFETLPFSVGEECLITGLGEEFCSNDELELKFYLNGGSSENVLDELIRRDDVLLISYGTLDEAAAQLDSLNSSETL